MLIVFAGLPGTGKTTLARALARKLQAVYVRIDTIESAIGTTATRAGTGYDVAFAVAEENLKLGTTVVADAVNALPGPRRRWRAAAQAARATILEIEVVCSDQQEHRRRIEARTNETTGAGSTWLDVTRRRYEPWDRQPAVIDTAGNAPDTPFEESLQASLLEVCALVERAR